MWNEYLNKTENQVRLGAGKKSDSEVVNVDVRDLDGIDIVHDLTEFNWPIDSNQFNVVVARDVIEHIPPVRKNNKDLLIQFIEEVHRISKQGAKVLFKWPHPKKDHQFGDPTHYRLLKPQFLTHFCPDKGHWGKSIKTKAKFELVKHKEQNKNFKAILEVL